MMFGYFFIIVGILLLLNELGIIAGNFWGFLWSMLFIVVGINMLSGKEKACCAFPWCKHRQDKHHDDPLV